MEIKDIKKAKMNLEDDICDMLCEFEELTGCIITNISIDKLDISEVSTRPRFINRTCIEVKL